MAMVPLEQFSRLRRPVDIGNSSLFDALQFMFKRTGQRFDLRDLCPVREGVRLNIEPDRRTELAQWFPVLHPDHSTGLAIL